MKEIDIIPYPPFDQLNSTNEYVAKRNGLIARQSARLLGGRVCALSESKGYDRYFIPSKILDYAEAAKLVIKTEADLLGSVVEAGLHTQKTIFHPLVAPRAARAHYYSEQFAQRVHDAVLPGFSVFSRDDAMDAAQRLAHQGYQVRLKDPTKNDSQGQYLIQSDAQLSAALATFTHDVAKHGAVLEANLNHPNELIVGQLFHGGDFYSYYGRKFEQTVAGRRIYGGTRLTMIRGGIRALYARTNGDLHTAVGQAATVYEAYSCFNPILSRINLDVLQGYSPDGQFLSGVIDQSLRVAGATPAELLAIEALIVDPSRSEVSAQSTVLHNPVDHVPANGEEYFDYSGRRDVARLL